MRNIFLVISNTLKVTFRKKGNIIIYLLLPLLGVFLSMLMYGGGSGGASVRIGVTGIDSGIPAADLKAALQSSNIFKISEIKNEDINKSLLDSKLDAVIVIPEGYSESIYGGSPQNIGVISLKGQDTTVWISQVINGFTDTLYKISLASGGDREMFDKIYGQYKEASVKLTLVSLEDVVTGRYMTLQSMGFLIMFIMLGAGLVNINILKEKRDRTYHRICSAPINAGQYIAGNAITGLLVTVVQILIIQAVMKYFLRIDSGVSDSAMFAILFMFGLVAVGLGLAITSFSASTYMAGTMSTLIMTPTCMLGGCFWDISFMPDFMQKAGYFVPQRWAIDAIRKIQDGGSVGDITINFVMLAAFATALIIVAIYRFSRANNVQKFV